MSMFPDVTGIDNMNNGCENAAELRSYWVTIYVQNNVIFVLRARGLVIELASASPYYVCRSGWRFQHTFPRQNRTKRPEAQGVHMQIKLFNSAVAVFLQVYEDSMNYARRKKS